ncbi:IS630 family transposase [Rhizophagus irregularis DAOM 181602=DAOM 197198]|nr:IS630 family transposase [Rhizophagus irregularis DAOM 181602=DAOM 197198]
MYDLTESERNQIIAYCDGKSLKTQPRSGCPKLLNIEHKKTLKKIVKKNNRQSAEQIKNKFQEKTNMEVSTKTIRRSLHELKFFSRIPASKPLLNDQQRENHLKWCVEKKIGLLQSGNQLYGVMKAGLLYLRMIVPGRIWRIPGTRFNIENIVPSIKHGGRGIMVWGCFSGKGLGPLAKVDYLFQDDNAPVHTAKNVKEWMKTKQIKILENWPSQSPDLNPLNTYDKN